MNRLSTALSRAPAGLAAPPVRVEVHLAPGLPGFALVGLPEAVVRESRERVRSAIINSGFDFPPGRITVNLAPADLPKEGGRFDLPIAIGILVASGQIPSGRLSRFELYGELALDGELKETAKLLPALRAAALTQHDVIVPAPNALEASWVGGARIQLARDLREVCAMLRSRCAAPTAPPGGAALPPSPEPAKSAAASTAPLETVPADTAPATPQDALPDLADVRGQYFAKRALELAAAGGHNLLMIGPPGTGKTLLAQCLPGLLPALSQDAALEVACLVSAAGGRPPLGARRPFRSPQHTASLSALIGSAAFRPGEIALAHHGVLFLDELPEFPRDVLEALREPLESGTVMLARAKRTVVFPASFQLVAAMNPCPCGHAGAASGRCRCTRTQVLRYRGRISGPLLDRIDLHVELSAVPVGHLVTETPAPGEPSAAVARRVAEAQRVQLERQGMLNARLASRALQERCRLDRSGLALARRAIERLGLSARAYHRVLKIARTIADLAGEPGIRAVDLSEAIGLRALDRDGKRVSGDRADVGRESTQRGGVERDSEHRGGVEPSALSRPD